VPRKPRWYDAIPDATTIVDCGGEQHRVTWRRGRLVVEAHDLSSERTMLAFGGELCPCMRVLEMWVEQFRMPPELFTQMPNWLGDNAFLVPDEFALPRRMGMVLSWERSWRFASWLPTRQGKLLEDEVRERALPHLRQHLNAWKARTGARVIAGCRIVTVKSSHPAEVAGDTDGVAMRAEGRLPGRWVVDVWVRGVATVEDAFVLTLVEVPSPDDLRVRASRWEPAPGSRVWKAVDAPARLSRDAEGTWHLAWEPA